MGTRKVTPLGGRTRVETDSRASARRNAVPSTPGELARAVSRFSPEQVANVGAALLIADRIERVELMLDRVLNVLIKHSGSDKPVASAESVEAVAVALDHLARRVAACEPARVPGLSFKASKKRTGKTPAGTTPAGEPAMCGVPDCPLVDNGRGWCVAHEVARRTP